MLGLVVDWIGTLFVGIVLAMVGGMFAAGWIEDDSVQKRAMQRLMKTPFLLFGLALGLGCTVGGGFVASGADPRLWWNNVLAMGVLSLVAYCIVGCLSERIAPYPLWYHVAGVILIIPAAFLGGWIRTLMP